MGFHLHPEAASAPGIVEGDYKWVMPQVGSERHTTQAPQGMIAKNVDMGESGGCATNGRITREMANRTHPFTNPRVSVFNREEKATLQHGLEFTVWDLCRSAKRGQGNGVSITHA